MGTSKEKTNQPIDDPFHQHQLCGTHVFLDSKHTFPMLLIVGIILLCFGIWLWMEIDQISEQTIDYTDCQGSNGITCEQELQKKNLTFSYQSCSCITQFIILKKIDGDILFYYKLTNFYQNYKRYITSKDDIQLNGKPGELKDACEPFRYNPETKEPYAPCGGIANSIFNDSFLLYYLDENQNQTILVPWYRFNITWESDRNELFGRPNSFANTSKLPNWRLSAFERSSNSYKGDEDLIVWMKLAAFPQFKKKYAWLKKQHLFKDGLPAGSYELHVNYSFPISYFNGTKGLFIVTNHWLGNKNYSISVIFMISGILHIVLSIFLLSWIYRRSSTIVPENSSNHH